MNGGADVFGALGWGLKRYAWLVALLVLGVGLLVPVALTRGPDVYEARAQVGPSKPLNLPNLAPLPRLGDSVFNDGAVSKAIQDKLRLPPTASVIPSRVDLVTAVDNIVFIVVGRGPNPGAAKRLANSAAATFTVELNKYTRSVGQFQIQRSADVPARPVPKLGGTIAIVLGILAGLVLGVGAVALLLVWRRPVIDAAAATDATGAPTLGRIRLARAGGNAGNAVGIAPLCRRLLGSRGDLVLLTSAPKAERERNQLALAMTQVFSMSHQVDATPAHQQNGHQPSVPGPGAAVGGASTRRELVIVDGPTPGQLATRPDTSITLLVVRQGASLSSLRRSAEQYLDDGPSGLVLVDPAPWYRRLWPRRARSQGQGDVQDTTGVEILAEPLDGATAAFPVPAPAPWWAAPDEPDMHVDELEEPVEDPEGPPPNTVTR